MAGLWALAVAAVARVVGHVRRGLDELVALAHGLRGRLCHGSATVGLASDRRL